MQSSSRASFTTRGDIRRQVEGFSSTGERNRDTVLDLSIFFNERGYATNQAPSKYWEEKLVTIGSVVVPKWVPVKEPSSTCKQDQGNDAIVGFEALYYPEKPPQRQPITLGHEENDAEEKEQESH